MTGERGQTATEYLGVLVFVGTIVAVLASSVGIDDRVRGSIRQAICKLANGEPCPQPRSSTRRVVARDVSAPSAALRLSGPPLGGGKGVFFLPFPGSASVSCTLSNRSRATCGGKGLQAGVRSTQTYSRTDARLGPDGCPTVSFGVSNTMERFISSQVSDLYKGKETTYGVTVPARLADDVAGKQVRPNPVDPRSIPVGGSLQMGEAFYTGAGLSSAYLKLQASVGASAGRRVATGVTRISPTTVRVYAGDEDFVKQASALGVSLGKLQAGISGNREVRDGDLRSVDVDLSSPDGWRTYQAFAQTGRLPKRGDGGTRAETSATTVGYSSGTSLTAKLGPLAAGFEGSSSEGSSTVTKNPDGTQVKTTTIRNNTVGVTMVQPQDALGRDKGKATYTLNLGGVTKPNIDILTDANGKPRVPRGGTATLRFTADDLRKVQRQAVRQVQYQYWERFGRVAPPTDQVRREARTGEVGGVAIDAFLGSVIDAAGPPQILSSFLDATALDGGAAVLERLSEFSARSRRAVRDGNVAGEVSELLRQARFPGTVGNPDCG